MNYPLQQWRLLITPGSGGAWNMAVDEAILENSERQDAKPCLRLYAWEPACVSIGYAQPWSDVDLQRLSSYGWDWVRRPTGGRAILHTDELTYSVIAPLSDRRVAGGVLNSYKRLSEALIIALHSLNIQAEVQPSIQPRANPTHDAVCFEVPSNYEIVVGGKKIIGSAQARRKKGLLQHGTFPLEGDLTRITDVLIFPDGAQRSHAARRLTAHATTAETVLGKKIRWEEAAKAFIFGFQTGLNIEFIREDLSEEEIAYTEELLNEKYTNRAWLERI